jgi:hypothetical protein
VITDSDNHNLLRLSPPPTWAEAWHLWTVLVPRRSITGRLVFGKVWRRHDGRHWIYKKFLSTPFKKNDRRSIGRTKIAKGAVLFFRGQTGVRSCRVTDITNVGAGIRVRGLAVFPPSFEFSFENFRTIRKCRLRWRDGEFVGIAFES